jgi:transposase
MRQDNFLKQYPGVGPLTASALAASIGNPRAFRDGRELYKDSITVAYAIGMGEVELLGKVGTTKTDIDRLCKRLQSKARHIRIVYEAGPCG